ncbi:MAG: hypothetical protein LUG95_03270 [Clostridiales bacterium]|nr:hypothetical protein [Clostridiales bacterium]
MDYDLQFISIFFILALCINYGNYKEIRLTSKLIVSLASLVLAGVNLIIGLSNFFNYIGEHEKSVYFYKNTPSMIILMQSTNQQQVAYDYAQDILNINDSVYEPNNVLSNIYAENEMYDEAVEQMKSVIEKDLRTMQHYRDYIDLCTAAEEYYEKGGESDKAQSCIDKIRQGSGL